MTEIDYLKLKLKDMEKAFDKLHQRHMVLLKEQGELERKNEQLRKYNEQLKERLERINGGYGHLAHRNGLTANEWLIESQERELKKKNEQISDWIEQHSKDIEKISEQQATISDLKEENEQLKEAKYEYKQDWKQASVNCDLYKQEISFLKEEIKGFEEENEQLRKLIDWSEINIADLIGDGV